MRHLTVAKGIKLIRLFFTGMWLAPPHTGVVCFILFIRNNAVGACGGFWICKI